MRTPRLSPPREAATYVFCLVESDRAPSLRGVPDSVPGAGAPRLLPVDRGVWAVVAEAPLARFASEQLQRDLQDVDAISRHALAHAAVIEFFFRRSPVIPLKLFTLFSSDDRVRSYLQGQHTRLRRLFAGIRGLEEWGVRVIAGEVEAESARSLGSGRDYLQTKKRLNDQSAAPPREVVRDAHATLKALGRLAARVRKEKLPPPGRGRPFVVGASFLVKAKRRSRWRNEIARLSASLAKRGHRLEMSGPWPPYHFVSR